ncbi:MULTISPECIES: SufS family cysteine desulfurase [Acidithrix]|uniref:cysteine desulfurase n=1 Tax=Acidithrix ferrooxidans TaxID=1280514 RepID=A0A0D8HIP9_9ACTN|nr:MULTISPECIES: SufS family cysteine desulfurase [Acidithrix]KJF17818.1 cysteine desulfurase SufS [Acidithrix ferrooxidans]
MGTLPEMPNLNELSFDPKVIKKDFPIFSQNRDKPLVFLDSGASSQRPTSVLDAMDDYYRTTHANVHRGVYALAEEATNRYEAARLKIGNFIGAPNPSKEIVFSKNSTESLNLIANSLGHGYLHAGDKVVLTKMEHHANHVPWIMLASYLGIKLEFIDHDEQGRLILDNLDQTLDGAKVVSLTLASNVLGTITPFSQIAQVAHSYGAIVVGDASQYVPHMPLNVKELGADLVAFTGHKMLGPTGVGVLWGNLKTLESMPPFLGGGDMIADVRLESYTPNELPYKFEAGTPPIAEVIGLGAAVDYLNNLGMQNIANHDRAIMKIALEKINDRFGDTIKIYGPKDYKERSGCISFSFENVHPHDISQILDLHGVCVRAGHHCAKPLMRELGVAATARASFHIYNDEDDVDALVEALAEAQRYFS